MMNNSSNVSIPRTAHLMERFNSRMMFLFGDNVRIDKEYLGWDATDGHRYDGACRPIEYSGDQLYVLEKGVQGVAVLWGDMADYQDRLVAEKLLRHYSIPKLREKVKQYMEDKGITEYNSEIGYRALWMKMAPQALIRECVHIYEITLDL